MEQLFSYLSRWGFASKAMTAASMYIDILNYSLSCYIIKICL